HNLAQRQGKSITLQKAAFREAAFLLSTASGLASEHIPQHEPQVCRTLCQPPHEIGIPITAIWNIDSHAIAFVHELLLQVAPYPIQHLKLELLRPYPLNFGKLPGRLNHLLVMSRYAMINA